MALILIGLGSGEKFDDSYERFTRLVRWGHWEMATPLVADDQRDAFIATMSVFRCAGSSVASSTMLTTSRTPPGPSSLLNRCRSRLIASAEPIAPSDLAILQTPHFTGSEKWARRARFF